MADSTQLEIDFGPLEELINDDTISEIMVNGPHNVFIERRGRLEKVSLSFESDDHLRSIIERIVSPLGRCPDESSPIVVARLADGSRVHVIIPPLALVGPTLTIRKFSKYVLTFDNLLAFGALNEDMADFLKACVKARLNILVAGGVNSGKTTLLNVIASTIPAEERIVTVEEMAEFRLMHEHVVALESRPPNIEGKGGVTVRDLVITCLHMRPDRILVGELNGPEVLEVLRLMDKGHDGTMTTVHADSPQEALERLEMMVKMSEPNLPVSYLRSLIGSAVDLVVQQNRLDDGSRKVVRVTEVSSVRGGDYDLRDVFLFLEEGYDEQGRVKGSFQARSVSARLRRRMEALGLNLPPEFVAVMEEETG